MAGSPKLKIYSPSGEYVAACKHAEDAAALVALYGNGAKIKLHHGRPLWVEGEEQQPASESYDHVAEVVERRIHSIQEEGKIQRETALHRASQRLQLPED